MFHVKRYGPGLRFMLLFLVFVLPPQWLLADSSVWRVSDGDSHIYLAGTIHLLRASDYPLPSVFEQAYQDADALYFETDIAGLTGLDTQVRMLQRLTYQDGRTLRSVLNDEAYAALENYAEDAGLPLVMLQTYKPGLLTSTLSLLEFQKLGFSPQGVDAYFHSRALADNKPRGELESIDSQIDTLASMGEGNESDFILYSLQDLDQLERQITDMVAAWRAGDMEALDSLLIQPMLVQSPALYQDLLVDRNQAWMPLIEAMFEQQGTEYVLVGAAHLVGDHGLLAMLTERGYRVSQLQAE
jgi:uncharacterized protein